MNTNNYLNFKDRLRTRGIPLKWLLLCALMLTCMAGTQQEAYGQSSANYAFATATNGSLVDMSTGTTQLVGATQDDAASAVTNIGFDFWLMGTRYATFGVNSNGYLRLGAAVSTTQYTLGTAATPLIAAYGSDLITSTVGKIHYKLLGTAPSRELVVEFKNETIIYDSGLGATTDGTYQIHLYESTGQIEFVYGSMNRNSSTGFNSGMDPQYIGFSISSVNNNYATIASSTNAVTYTGALTSNQPALSAPIPNLNSAADGSRRIYTLSPPALTAPSALSFSPVTATGMTLNWTDNSTGETGFAIYQSTDGVNFSFLTQTAANATSYAASGLTPGTTYYYRVFAVSEGNLGTALSGNQATPAAPSIVSTGAGGPWSSTATWVGGAIPTSSDNVTIANGATVTVDVAANCYALTVGQGTSGILQFEQTTARVLTVGSNVVVASGGTFQSNNAGAITHTLSVGGNLTNNGTLDFSTSGNTAGAGITFTGASNATFGGTGGTTDLRTLTINKGSGTSGILELNPTNLTVQGANTDGAAAAFLTLTNGTLKVSGSFTATFRTFTTAAYTIGSTAGFWLNNPNYTVAGQNGSPTLSGLLRISQGTFNIGTSSGNSMGFATNSTILLEGGSVNAAGRFGVAAAGNVINYTQSGGTVTVCTVGNASTTLGSFDLGTSLSSTINITGGTAVCQLAATTIDYRNQAGGGLTGVTGGTIQFGNASSGAAKAFNVRGVLPNVVISNASGNHSVTMSTTLANYNNLTGNITINAGNTFNTGNVVFLFNGTVLTNNGTLTANGVNSNFNLFQASAPVLYTGTGVVTAPITALSSQASMGFTIDPSSNNIPCLAFRLFNGNVTNANKLTIGNGGATTGTIQIGNTTTPTSAGTFDVAPTFNLGTGGQVVSYLRTSTSRITGPEINGTRTLTNLAFDDNDATHTFTISGGDITVNTTLSLANGRVITGANNLISASGGTVNRTAGYVDGGFTKTYTTTGSKVYEMGTSAGYTPVTANVTAGTGSLNVRITPTSLPAVSPADALNRYWTLTSGGPTMANLTLPYQAAEVTGVESSYIPFQLLSGVLSNPAGSINAVTHTLTVTGVNPSGSFTAAQPAVRWSGNSSTAAISAANWAPAIVPGALYSVVVPSSGVANELDINADITNANFDIQASRVVTIDAGVTLNVTGTMSNAGTIMGNGAITNAAFTNNGTIAPGLSPGQLTINGNFANVGTLAMQVDGLAGAGVAGGHDQLVVNGDMVYGGVMNVDFGMFVPTIGQTFQLINVTGTPSGSIVVNITPNTVNGTFNSTTGVFTVAAPLPLQLISFTGQLEANKGKLSWTVAQERNLTGYRIERSADGRSFSEIGTLAATNAVSRHSYFFSDESLMEGDNFYRLRMLDNDGSFTYSNIVKIATRSASGIIAGPNPAKAGQDIKVSVNGLNVESWSLINSVGQLLQSGTGNTGNHFQINGSSLVPGLYLLNIQTDKGQQLQRIVVQ